MQAPRVILTIAGFDPSSGAGITADLKTIAAHGCYGISCITAVTVQSTQGVDRVEPLPPILVRDTLTVLAKDFEIAVVKVGMLASAKIVRAVADFLGEKNWPIVLDPVLKSSSGMPLLDNSGRRVMASSLIPISLVVTPNLHEAETITGISVKNQLEMKAACRRFKELGAKNVVLTGGHLPGALAIDVLSTFDGGMEELEAERLVGKSTHGTGCAFSSAIACNLALGQGIAEAARNAKSYVHEAIRTAAPFGKGSGRLNHFHPFQR